jgi:hypothetical protein
VKVLAIRSTHIADHASYRVDTPAGSVVIGGDASNDVTALPRAHSTSDQVEKLAQGADVIVHSTMHPILGPDKGSGFPPPAFYRQSMTTDLGAMAKRVGAKYLMLTHLARSLGTGAAQPVGRSGRSTDATIEKKRTGTDQEGIDRLLRKARKDGMEVATVAGVEHFDWLPNGRGCSAEV